MVDPILQIFQEETTEHIRALENGFLDLESAPDLESRRLLIDGLFRHAHSLKGDARVIGLEELQQVSQRLEDLLDALRRQPAKLTSVEIDSGLKQLDEIRRAYQTWTQSHAAPFTERQPDPSGVVLTADPPPSTGDAEEIFAVRVPSDRLDRMLNLAGEARIAQRSSSASAGQLNELQQHLDQLRQEVAGPPCKTIEMILDAVRRLASGLRNCHLREQLLVEELEKDIQQARLLPLSRLAESMRRALRDLAQTLNKQIRYEIQVGSILLDKAVIEALKAPMLHLLRNASDHGIESEAERIAAGKPAEGTIAITARERGDTVQIRISDDGGGLNFGRIREQVLLRSGMSPDEFDELNWQQQAAHLFQPGFTTAPVGAVSGRGVGLDVVRDTLQRLHGKVELEASSAAGTTFLLTVPISISTMRIVTFWNGGHAYGIPSSSVIRSGRVRTSEIRELEGQRVVFLEGGVPVRWVGMRDFLGIAGNSRAPSQEYESYLLILRDGQQVAISVDELDEEREVLLKPLGFPVTGMPGILGGTIRPDGAVQVVLNLEDVRFRGFESQTVPRVSREQIPRILVVDDSPTTRTILRNIFSAEGYQVVVAADGMDALEKLRRSTFQLVVSDFEMPRLNGVDLTRQVKARYGLPVILVTGREREEYRREGLEAGADAYVVKSTFEGAGLLEVVRQFV
ncbi:hybrid sensor histidine kinase/response regulator [Planctomicrobium sp. SH664]|uniref:hybrid sensor histidine kinase/response regulator n=1 Tax=Planctomicrobium sp. SH664 TaxID=3448125 RepID=UPI003F5B233A